MTPGWDPSGVSLGLGREGMEGRGEPGHGLRRGEVMGEGQGMRTGLLPAGGGWEGGKGSVSSASWTPSSEERRNTCGHTSTSVYALVWRTQEESTLINDHNGVGQTCR